MDHAFREVMLKDAQKHFTIPLTPLVLDANANPLSITAVIAGLQEESGSHAIENDAKDKPSADFTVTPLGSYVLLTDKMHQNLVSGGSSLDDASDDLNNLLGLIPSSGIGAFVPVTTAGLDYDLAVTSTGWIGWTMWLSSKPAPSPSGSNAATDTMIYTLGSYAPATGICTSTSLQITGASAGWLRLWIGVALAVAAAGAFSASVGSVPRGIDLVKVMTIKRGGTDWLISLGGIPFGGSFMGGLGLGAAGDFINAPPDSVFGFGATIWNLDPNNDMKITAPYILNAYIPSDAGPGFDTWQDTTIPKATPAGVVWTPEGFNPKVPLTTACCTANFLFMYDNSGSSVGAAMCAISGADSTGFGLKAAFQLNETRTFETGMQTGIVPEGPAVEAFYNDSSSFNTVPQPMVSVTIGPDVAKGNTRKPQVCQVTFLLGSTSPA